MKSRKQLAALLLVIVAGGYSLLNVAVRLMNQGFGPITQVYLRIALGAVVGTLIFWKQIRWRRIQTAPISDWLKLLLMGIVGYALMVYFITLGALKAKLLNVSVVYSTVVFFSYIYSIFVLRRKFAWKILGLVILSFWGVATIATKSIMPHLSGLGVGEFFVLLSALTGAWYYVGRKMLSDHLNSAEIAITTMYIAAVTTLLMALLAGETVNWVAFTGASVLLGLGIGSLFNVVATFIENFSFKYLEAVVGSQILLLESVFSLLLGYFLYQEMAGFPELIGAILVVLSVYWLNRVVEG